jgi:hypothetical protein
LYSSKARFLMELIQNADDNKYSQSVTPTLRISVFNKYVKIECNEKGFTRKHIESLCRTGRSSKEAGGGYTGEKGIGFKSVFKIAKRAHIRSYPYYFKLDQDRSLGMITPEWDEAYFADHSDMYQTTIILDHICDPSKNFNFSATLKKDIDEIHPIVILFLRRIKRLHVTRYESSFWELTVKAVSKCFQRYDDTSIPNISCLKDEDSGFIDYFYKFDYHSVFLGTEPRRPESSTKIELAFPIKRASSWPKPWVPNPRILPTFAYLPLGKFGFEVGYLAQRQNGALTGE